MLVPMLLMSLLLLSPVSSDAVASPQLSIWDIILNKPDVEKTEEWFNTRDTIAQMLGKLHDKLINLSLVAASLNMLQLISCKDERLSYDLNLYAVRLDVLNSSAVFHPIDLV